MTTMNNAKQDNRRSKINAGRVDRTGLLRNSMDQGRLPAGQSGVSTVRTQPNGDPESLILWGADDGDR